MDTKEKRLMEAFASYESGESLATLQTVFSDVAVELNQMIEAERIVRQAKPMMRLSQELGRKVVAGLAQRQRQKEASIFMSGLWRLAAPVGIAALSFMFILSSQEILQPELRVEEQVDLFAVQEAAPMMAKNAAVSLMAVAPEQGEEGAIEAPAANSFSLMADEGAGDVPEEGSSTDTLYRWQMIALGLLALLSILVFVKHLRIRAATRAL